MLRASMRSDDVDNRSDSRLSLGAKHFLFILSLSFFFFKSLKCYGLEALPSSASAEQTQ